MTKFLMTDQFNPKKATVFTLKYFRFKKKYTISYNNLK